MARKLALYTRTKNRNYLRYSDFCVYKVPLCSLHTHFSLTLLIRFQYTFSLFLLYPSWFFSQVFLFWFLIWFFFDFRGLFVFVVYLYAFVLSKCLKHLFWRFVYRKCKIFFADFWKVFSIWRLKKSHYGSSRVVVAAKSKKNCKL